MKLLSLDTETFRIGPGAIAPEPVCITLYDGTTPIIGVGEEFGIMAREALEEYELILANAAYDLGVIANHDPDTLPLIFKALKEKRIHDVQIKEKLHCLGTHGSITLLELPDGSHSPISFSLAELEKQYLGWDRSEEKHGEDVWRTNYGMLAKLSVDKWPEAAKRYAIDDAIGTYEIYKAQEDHCNQGTEHLHVYSAFCLFLMTMTGWKVNHEEVAKVEEFLAEELSADKLRLITKAGILRPAEPPRPKLRGTGMTKGKKASVNKKVLGTHISHICDANGFEIKETASGAVCCDAEVINDLAPYDDVIAEYQHRQTLQKLVTTYLPIFTWEDEPVDRVHFSYDVLKETGRTSSRKNRLYPSTNGQQVDPRVRQCFEADEGYILCSIDYSSLELCSLSWTIKQNIGESRLYDLLEANGDPHAYLGSQLARNLDPTFRQVTEPLDADETYEVFLRCQEIEEKAAFYDHYRTFAKPTGLGYPGGLGPETFLSFAKTSYNVDVRKMAMELQKEGRLPEYGGYTPTDDPGIILAWYLREVWFEAFPEMREYFDTINTFEYEEGKYSYTTPLGMERVGCTFCSASNGWGMQSPSGEGAKGAVCRVSTACWDPTEESILYGSLPMAFIHDEIITQFTEDEHMFAKAEEQVRLMIEPMQETMPGIICRAEPAFMHKWDKKAKSKKLEDGTYTIWN